MRDVLYLGIEYCDLHVNLKMSSGHGFEALWIYWVFLVNVLWVRRFEQSPSVALVKPRKYRNNVSCYRDMAEIWLKALENLIQSIVNLAQKGLTFSLLLATEEAFEETADQDQTAQNVQSDL